MPWPVVIDTQTLMEWLVFRDPIGLELGQALGNGQLRWLGCPAMREELLHVLGRGVAQRWNPDLAAIEAAFASHCTELAEAQTDMRLRCRDGDDQKFIDFALAQGCFALLTRDKDLRALAKRARARGLWVAPAENVLDALRLSISQACSSASAAT
ncbi:putative toxin-antitoxin system toxin component, PIN family [Roseateles sp. BYS180W]|uniref:Toxin-antitoxin system toxin component, PIN family n=1 Tax=Roseateles rivi TaxID=3299028 RepID=A0ABW7FWD9_9BURK